MEIFWILFGLYAIYRLIRSLVLAFKDELRGVDIDWSLVKQEERRLRI